MRRGLARYTQAKIKPLASKGKAMFKQNKILCKPNFHLLQTQSKKKINYIIFIV